MKITRRRDLAFAVAAALPLPVAVWLVGDPLFMGRWYGLAVPAAAIGLAMLFRVRAFFLTGVSLAATLTLLAYMLITVYVVRQQGLLGLGHLASLPGAGLGIVAGAGLLRRWPGPLAGLFCGSLGLLGGFLLNQLVVCNTLMWCGPLSWPIR
jgi:hypothetical protein